MKRLLGQIRKITEKIEEDVNSRSVTFDIRSDVWQESEKGASYEDKTMKLEEILQDLGGVADDIKDYIADI